MSKRKALFVVSPPPRKATEKDWQDYIKRNQNWMTAYFVAIYLTIGAMVGLAYLLHVFLFSKT